MLKTMDPEFARQLIEKEPDVLTPLVKEEEKRYAVLRCPVCYQSGCVKKLIPTRIIETPDGPQTLSSPFGSSPIPEGYAHCNSCDTDFDAASGIILKSAHAMISPP